MGSVPICHPYGLAWGRQLPMDPTTAYNETYIGSEFNYHEWGDVGMDLNYFEARYYDPVLGRFHAPDPYEQFHSPYMANFDDPANHIDPDGRASKDREWNLQTAGGIATNLGFMAWIIFGGNSGVGQAVEAVAALANLGGAYSTIASMSGCGLTQLTQSPTVPDASASLQSSMNGNGPETGASGAEDIGVTDPPAGDPSAMQMGSSNQAAVKPTAGGIWIQDNTLKASDGTSLKYKYQRNGSLVDQDGNSYKQGQSSYIDNVYDDLEILRNIDDDLLNYRLCVLQTSSNTHTISKTQVAMTKPFTQTTTGHHNDPEGLIPTDSIIRYDPNYNLEPDDPEKLLTVSEPAVHLAHELLAHAYDFDIGGMTLGKANNGIDLADIDAVNIANRARAALGIRKRLKYGGKYIPKELLEDTHK